jgi:protein tyrosine/serine phosphatase
MHSCCEHDRIAERCKFRNQHTMANQELLTTLIDVPMETPIQEADLDKALNLPPFVAIPGTFNTRDISHPPFLRAGLIYRSGSPSGLTSERKERLVQDLHVEMIFDLRSLKEKKVFPIPKLKEEYGIETVSLTPDTLPAEVSIADFASSPEARETWIGGANGFSKMYLEMLEIYKTAFREVLNHLITNPGSPILFNCTAGKDRTGTLAALILSLAGVSDQDIAFDYALSRIGVEPQREFLTAVVRKWQPEWKDDTPGVKDFSNVRQEYMLKFLEGARAMYKGGAEPENWAERYARSGLGLTASEIETLKENLR